MNREHALALMHEYVRNESLRRHMLAVEAAMRWYAKDLGEDADEWGIVGLLHDFDYERWPSAPEHPVEGSRILREKGYPEEVIYAILSHADYLAAYPRINGMDRALYACDELCGFLVACALVRPERFCGMEPKSVKKKLKNLSFAASVSREDIERGAQDFGVELDQHIANCIAALQPIQHQLIDD